MKRYFIQLAFKGSNYHGWQIQPNAISVQEKVENALNVYFSKKIPIVGAGRTDTGVHAKMMMAHFDLDGEVALDNLAYKLNSILPKDIVVQKVVEVTESAHARFDAIYRSYEYFVMTNDDPFHLDLRYRHYTTLDLGKMNKAAKFLLGEHDFSCFSKSKTQTFTNNCNISIAKWETIENGVIRFDITANRFLRNMVRAIVGTLIEVGEGKRSVDSIPDLINSKSRSQAGTSVPAHGLYLTDIGYPNDIWQH